MIQRKVKIRKIENSIVYYKDSIVFSCLVKNSEKMPLNWKSNSLQRCLLTVHGGQILHAKPVLVWLSNQKSQFCNWKTVLFCRKPQSSSLCKRWNLWKLKRKTVNRSTQWVFYSICAPFVTRLKSILVQKCQTQKAKPLGLASVVTAFALHVVRPSLSST